MTDLVQLEQTTMELLKIYDVHTPPIPVESMLQHPRQSMWQEMDVTQISGSFLKVRDVYSPRMSLARLLARHVITSDWGQERGLQSVGRDEALLHAFARMLVMPRSMVTAMAGGARTPTAMSIHFEVPEEDALIRLEEIARYRD